MEVSNTLDIDLTSNYLINLSLPTEKYYAYSIHSLFDDSNSRVELTRAYRCISNQTIGGFKGSGLGIMTNVSVWVRDLTVQAFNFTEINGTFATGQGKWPGLVSGVED